jgi:hypothetical protein
MTTTDLDPADAQDQADPSQSSDGIEPADQAEENERERELQRRLTQQGREAAEARRAAAYAQQHAQTLQGTVTELQAQVRLLTESMSEAQNAEVARRQREMDAYLETLPPEQRLDRKIAILGEQIKQLQRPAVTPSQPAQRPQPQQSQAPQTEQDSVEYMRRRAVEIVGEAERDFGVKVDVSTLDDAAWETEDSFYKAVMREAARGGQNGDTTVPRKAPANETPQQMQQRIRREIQEELGVSSPAAPKGTARASKKPTDADVRTLVDGYNSAKGPKAAAAKLREMRERMG